jgi:hypothetical protein
MLALVPRHFPIPSHCLLDCDLQNFIHFIHGLCPLEFDHGTKRVEAPELFHVKPTQEYLSLEGRID